MVEAIRRWSLKNGLELEALDLSQNYYAQYWNVKLVIRGTVRVDPSYLEGLTADPLAEEARKELGEEVEYRRELTKVGIPEEELERAKEELLSFFEGNSLPYLEHEAFPERFVRRRFQELLKEAKVRKMREELRKEEGP